MYKLIAPAVAAAVIAPAGLALAEPVVFHAGTYRAVRDRDSDLADSPEVAREGSRVTPDDRPLQEGGDMRRNAPRYQTVRDTDAETIVF
jgi:hypothetical protein